MDEPIYKRDSFRLYEFFGDIIKELGTTAEQMALIDAIIDFGLYHFEPDFSEFPECVSRWARIRPAMQRDWRKWAKKRIAKLNKIKSRLEGADNGR